jgi:hypothetical protein
MGRRPQPEATRLTVHIGTKLTASDAAAFEARCAELGTNEHTAVRTAVLQWLGAVSPLDPALESAVEAAVERGVRKALKVRGALAAAVAEVEVDAVEAEELAALGAAILERRESRAKLAARLGCATKTINEWIDGDHRRRRMTPEERAALGLPPRQLELVTADDPRP